MGSCCFSGVSQSKLQKMLDCKDLKKVEKFLDGCVENYMSREYFKKWIEMPDIRYSGIYAILLMMEKTHKYHGYIEELLYCIIQLKHEDCGLVYTENEIINYGLVEKNTK